jgi:hypothetical protein
VLPWDVSRNGVRSFTVALRTAPPRSPATSDSRNGLPGQPRQLYASSSFVSRSSDLGDRSNWRDSNEVVRSPHEVHQPACVLVGIFGFYPVLRRRRIFLRIRLCCFAFATEAFLVARGFGFDGVVLQAARGLRSSPLLR